MTAHAGFQPLTCFGVLSVNLWNGRADARALDEVIARLRPDVVMAQELAHDCAQVLRARFPHTWLRPRSDTFGMGIATRLPARFRELSMPRRVFPAARVAPFADKPECAVDLVNVHLSCPQWPSRFVERAIQVRRLLSMHARDPVPRVLAGDFNTARAMPAYAQLSRSFTDAAREAAAQSRLPCGDARVDSDRTLAPTWGPTAKARRLLRIDHVMTSALSTLSFRTVAVRGSDHDAVFARLALPEGVLTPAGR